MPRLSASAPLMASGSPVNASAAARPATIPSGRLCNVTASTIRPPCPAPPASSCPANCSTCKRPTAPSTSPTADGIHAGSGKVCPRWIAGSSRLHTLAANMMPAAIPLSTRWVRGAAQDALRAGPRPPPQQKHACCPQCSARRRKQQYPRSENDLVHDTFPLCPVYVRRSKKVQKSPSHKIQCDGLFCQNVMASSSLPKGADP